MTFGELCKQTSKECGVGVSYDQMQRILVTSWRLRIEELMIKPGESRIMLSGLLQIYLKKRTVQCGIWKGKELVGSEPREHYVFRIKPGIMLKHVMCGMNDIRELRVGGIPLYFDKETLKMGNVAYKNGKIMLDKATRKEKMEDPALKEIIAEREKQKFKNRLPED